MFTIAAVRTAHAARLVSLTAIGMFLSGCNSQSCDFAIRPRLDGSEVAVLEDPACAWPTYASEYIASAEAAYAQQTAATQAAAQLGVRTEIERLYDILDQENARLRGWLIAQYAQYINGELEADLAARERARAQWHTAQLRLLESSEEVRLTVERLREVQTLAAEQTAAAAETAEELIERCSRALAEQELRPVAP